MVASKDILAALELAGAKGATRAEIGDVLGMKGDKALQAVSNHLNVFLRKGLVSKANGQWRLVADVTERTQQQSPAHVAITTPAAQAAHFNGNRVELPAIAKNRTGRTVGVYALPVEAEDVVQVQMCVGGQWVKLPLYADLRICIDSGVPNWSAQQETNRNVSTLRLVKRGGGVCRFPRRHWAACHH